MTCTTRSLHAWHLVALLLCLLLICGCGGGGPNSPMGGATGPTSGTPASDSMMRITGAVRAVLLNSYGVWQMGTTSDPPSVLEARLQTLARSCRIAYAENMEWPNDVPGWSKLTPSSIRRLNPTARVYRYFTLMSKDANDSDWTNQSKVRMSSPLTRGMIETNNWWLRDGDGSIVVDANQHTYYLDVGKPGFKEAYLQSMLSRIQDKGFTGVLLDFWHPNIASTWFAVPGGWFTTHPMPTAYPTADAWYTNAWRPFVTYVVAGLRNAGYRIVGNSVGENGTTDSAYVLQRSLVDSVVYEQWALDYGGGWLPASRIQARMSAMASDPLEVWITEAGIRRDMADFGNKQMVSLAMYYLAAPRQYPSQVTRTYYHAYNTLPYWDTVWDLQIGTPVGAAKRMDGKYCWTRQFTSGLVAMNYESSADMSLTLDGTFYDVTGNVYTGTVTVHPHSAMILSTAPPQR